MGLPRFWRNLCCSHPQFLSCGSLRPPTFWVLCLVSPPAAWDFFFMFSGKNLSSCVGNREKFRWDLRLSWQNLAKRLLSQGVFQLSRFFHILRRHRSIVDVSLVALQKRNKHWHTLILKCPLEKDMFMLPRGCCNMMMYIQYRQTLAVSICKMHLLHYIIIMVSNI